MTRKARLALFIKEHPRATFGDWVQYQHDNPDVRIKQVGKSGVQIQIEGSKAFIDPLSWLHNYEAGQKVNLRNALNQALEALSEQEISKVLEESGLVVTDPKSMDAEYSKGYAAGSFDELKSILHLFQNKWIDTADYKDDHAQQYDIDKLGLTYPALFTTICGPTFEKYHKSPPKAYQGWMDYINELLRD